MDPMSYDRTVDPDPPMSDLDIIRDVERQLTELHGELLRLTDEEYPPESFDFERDVMEPINTILCLIEEQRP